eukprot:TRINITY_DN1376_c0_g1_i1.p1 TRINITY_DN1376_c0_g1~~TRINITY_DN1376_c0_g1_i1.p1  ORF type:complete len:189 (+),score=72.13 TRINITY_DN1376_c0_g1_i1:109-675(+)
MLLLTFFWGWLYQLGFFNKDATVILLGLDNAGKTTLLSKLKTGATHQFAPTERAQNEDIVIGKVKINAWDLGGHEQVRFAWNQYFVQADAVIFMVDSHDKERMSEAREEIQFLLEDEELEDVPFVIIGNKIDLNGSLGRKEIIEELDLETRIVESENDSEARKIEVFSCSVIEGIGIEDAFEWLSNVV